MWDLSKNLKIWSSPEFRSHKDTFITVSYTTPKPLWHIVLAWSWIKKEKKEKKEINIIKRKYLNVVHLVNGMSVKNVCKFIKEIISCFLCCSLNAPFNIHLNEQIHRCNHIISIQALTEFNNIKPQVCSQ